MPLLLTGLQPGKSLTVSVVRYGINSLAAGPPCCARPTATITFTTASTPLAVGLLALAPNLAHGSATLTLGALLPVPATVLVLDAVGVAQ